MNFNETALNPYPETPYREAEDVYQPRSSHKQRPTYQHITPSYDDRQPSPHPGTAYRHQPITNNTKDYRNRETDFDHYSPRNEEEEYRPLKRRRTEPQPVEDERIIAPAVTAPPSAQESKKGFIDTVTEKAESLNLEQKADTAIKLTNTANKLLSMFGGFGG